MIASLLAIAALTSASGATAASPAQQIQHSPRVETVRRYESEARQGVAVGPDAVYAVSNSSIVRYDKTTGEEEARWTGDADRFPHVNSCSLIDEELVCASSNFPAVPHISTVEIFDPVDLTHKRSVALGLGTGSITWIERRDGFWWAMFANYSSRGGETPRNHRHTTLVKFDDHWRRMESWALPNSILTRLEPMSISGGGWGPDDRLYISGHDLPELYVVAIPQGGGGVLEHIQTIRMEAEGQAIDWDESEPGMLYGIRRQTQQIVAMRVLQER